MKTGLTPLLVEFMRNCLADGTVDSVMVPFNGPGDSFPWMLVTDPAMLEKAEPLPPIMSVHGAKALASFAQTSGKGRILAVLRPCEARAAIELSKLEQIDLGNIILLTMDCPGAVPLSEYGENGIIEPDWSDSDTVRPLCRQCTEFTEAGDICLALHGDGEIFVPLTEAGESLLASLDMQSDADTSSWRKWAGDLTEKRMKIKETEREILRNACGGLDGLTEVFSGCIGCRNCRTVCPICYCRLCFIDMKDRRSPAGDYLDHSRKAGAARLSANTLLFHIGRMAHMSLSCVSCGMCEDACPSDIPIGRLVSMVSGSTADLFSYNAGEDPLVPIPLNTFQKDELHDFED